MTVTVAYKCEQTPDSRFRAKGEMIIFAEGSYVIHEFRDPDDSLTFDTRADAEGDVLKAVENEVAAILARSQDRVAIRGGRRHEEDWQEQS